MTIIDITAKHPLDVCENVVTVPEMSSELQCPYKMIRVTDWNDEKRYECPQCPKFYTVVYFDYGQCKPLGTACKIALARSDDYACPLGYRSPP